MQRTIRFPLLSTPEQEPVPLETMLQYTVCFNTVAAYGWERGEENGVELHRAIYYPLRAEHPQLPAQLSSPALGAGKDTANGTKVRQPDKQRRKQKLCVCQKEMYYLFPHLA